jgi:archaellum biogenesis ATPase FlaH
MIRNELVKKSPLRILENSIHGGLAKGHIGVIAAPKGVGKTACLVHIATDQLLEGKHVIHVSFASDTQHIITWYEDIFDELAKRNNLESADDVHDEIIRNRVIMNFRQDSVSAVQMLKSVRSMIKDGNFNADVVIIDGYDFAKSTATEIAEFKQFAKGTGLAIWFSVATLKDTTVSRDKIPAFLNTFFVFFDVFIMLEPCDKYIHFKLVKDRDSFPESDLHLKLDPQILLIAEETGSMAG